MQNLEVLARKLTELWPFQFFSKKITYVKNWDIQTDLDTDRQTDRQSDLYYPLVADKKV